MASLAMTSQAPFSQLYPTATEGESHFVVFTADTVFLLASMKQSLLLDDLWVSLVARCKKDSVAQWTFSDRGHCLVFHQCSVLCWCSAVPEIYSHKSRGGQHRFGLQRPIILLLFRILFTLCGRWFLLLLCYVLTFLFHETYNTFSIAE